MIFSVSPDKLKIERSINFYKTTRQNNPEGSHFHVLRIFQKILLRRTFGLNKEGESNKM